MRYNLPTDDEEKIWTQIVQHTTLIYQVTHEDFENTRKRNRNLSACRREVWYRSNQSGLSLACIALLHIVDLETVRFGVAKFKADVLGEADQSYQRRIQTKRSQALKSSINRRLRSARRAHSISNPKI